MTTKVNSNLIGNTEVHYFHLNSDIYGSSSTTTVRGNTSIQINTTGSLTGGGTLVLGAGGTLTIDYTEPTNPSYSSVTVTNGGKMTGFSTTVSGTTPTTVASYSATTYGGAKIVILAIDQASGVRQTTELLASNTTSEVVATQYGTVTTSGTIGTFELSIVTGNVTVVATGVSGNTVIYKVLITLLPN
jgi:beta-galactosidase GanA